MRTPAHALGGYAAAHGGNAAYLPKWSEDTLHEITRNLTGKFNKTPDQAKRREDAMRIHFPEALVTGYEMLIPAMTNDEKDRHILAATIASGAKLIVTYNAKHFRAAALDPYGIDCQGPSTFLISLYDLEPGIVVQKLSEQAQNIGISLVDLLVRLRVNVPAFVTFFCDEQKIELPAVD
jgi:hypothetical protein